MRTTNIICQTESIRHHSLLLCLVLGIKTGPYLGTSTISSAPVSTFPFDIDSFLCGQAGFELDIFLPQLPKYLVSKACSTRPGPSFYLYS